MPPPSSPALSRLARTLALATAVSLAWLAGLLVRTLDADVALVGATADRDGYRVAAGAGLTTALLLAVGLLAAVAMGAPSWLRYLTAAGVATQLALGVTAWWSSRPVDDTAVLSASAWDGAADVLLRPLSWPLLAVLVVAAVAALRGRSSRSPR